MTYGLQMGSISSVDSAIAIRGLDHVRTSTFQDFSHCTSYPLQGTCPMLIWEELYFLLHLENV